MFSPGSAVFQQGRELSVEVNQRALIDKILARYSGEFTIFRELLQNADDAGAKTVKIRFYTEDGMSESPTKDAALPNLKTVPIHRYVCINDGIPFRDQDWNRLRKIAEGNPDDDKIGAFGVGYYSVFAITEKPMVTSGSKWMAFYFKDGRDQLYARSGDLPPAQANEGATAFTMDLRNPGPLEGPLDLARFLVTSLTFMLNIRKIEMWVDEWNILQLQKEVGPKKKVETTALTRRRDGKGLISPEGIMHIEGVDCTGVKISANVMRWLQDSGFIPPPLPPPRPVKAAATGFASMLHSALFSRSTTPIAQTTPISPPKPKDMKELLESSMTLQIFGADVRVTMKSALEKEIERSTKKPPPKNTRLQLIFSNADDRTEEDSRDEAEGIFAGLKPDLNGDRTARVFIGQATGQTTGMGGHLAGRFIPTVERESIDLIDKHVAIWNRELLYVGGYVARIIYEVEMEDIRKAWEGNVPNSQPDKPVREWLSNRALHVLRFFTYHTSTPSPLISRSMELAFFQSLGGTSLPILSSLGVRGADVVRMPHPMLMTFLSGVPVLRTEFIEKADLMVGRLKERGMLRDISLDDIIKQLSVTPLDDSQMVACLKWWQSMASLPEYNASLRVKLLDAAILTTKDPLANGTNDKVVPLSSIKTYLNPALIPTDMPLPPDTLPHSVSRHLSTSHLSAEFGWQELSLARWLSFLSQPPMVGGVYSAEYDVTLSTDFSERVLNTLARHWMGLSKQQQASIESILRATPCIPTKLGFKRPGDAYFCNVDLFPDLAIIVLPNSAIKGSLRAILVSAGVRSHVELQMVFTRLVGASKWSCYELMRYLVSVKDTLSETELARLKRTAAFPVEDVDATSPTEGDAAKKIKRVTPDELYEPTPEHRKLKLEVLDWGAAWRPHCEEAKFIFNLGLRRKVTLPTLLRLASQTMDEETRSSALTYLIANVAHYTGFSALNHAGFAFVPAIASNGQRFYAKPTEAFMNPACSVMGFAIVAPIPDDGAKKLKLLTDVPTEQLIARLQERPPATIDMAVKQYEYLATRLADFYKDGTLNTLRNIPFIRAKAVQAKSADANATVLARPGEVFFTPTQTSGDSLYQVYKLLFLFVDYGKTANSFLEAIGVKNQPSTEQLADMIVRDPPRFLQLAQSGEVYLAQLRILATSYASLPAETKRQMTKSAFLLAGKKIQTQNAQKRMLMGGLLAAKDSIADEDEDEGIIDWDLSRATEICIVDDANAYNLFGTDIKSAPQEDLLEDFYSRLGSPALSTLVKEEYKVAGIPQANTERAKALRQLVLERLALFLSERNRSLSDLTLDHLKKEGNFQVLETQSVSLKRTFKHGQMERTNLQEVSAAAIKARGNVVSLYLSRSVELDMYEVAVGLTKTLFKRMRPDEPLLLMTILSTPLAALRRRGFNVDRILNQQKVERLAREAEFQEKRLQEKKDAMKGLSPSEMEAAVRELHDLFPNEDPRALLALLNEQKSDHLVNATETLLTRNSHRPPPAPSSPSSKRKSSIGSFGTPGSTTSLLGNLRSKFRGSSSHGDKNGPVVPESGGAGTSEGHDSSGREGRSQQPASAGDIPGPPVPTRSGNPTTSSADITPYENIRQSAIRAVQASRSNTAREIVSQNRQTYVKESADTYCDLSGVKSDLVAAGMVPATNIPLFLSRDVAGQATHLLQEKGAAFQRFTDRIIIPLGRVFQLEPTSLHIFYDTAGPLIAFNRAGSLFMNARYYMAWHDHQVIDNDLTEAYISWFFTLVHEISHNSVAQHNAEHEFLMTSISETYLMTLMRLLAKEDNGLIA